MIGRSKGGTPTRTLSECRQEIEERWEGWKSGEGEELRGRKRRRRIGRTKGWVQRDAKVHEATRLRLRSRTRLQRSQHPLPPPSPPRRQCRISRRRSARRPRIASCRHGRCNRAFDCTPCRRSSSAFWRRSVARMSHPMLLLQKSWSREGLASEWRASRNPPRGC